MGKFCRILTVCQPHDSGGLLLFHVFIYLVDLALLFHVELARECLMSKIKDICKQM